jgi:hypothetical protein
MDIIACPVFLTLCISLGPKVENHTANTITIHKFVHDLPESQVWHTDGKNLRTK